MEGTYKNLDAVIQAIQAPLLKRIIHLEKKVEKLESGKCLDFVLDDRVVIRRIVAAEMLMIDPTTLDKYIRDPLNPIESTKVGKNVYVYLDSIEQYQQMYSKH